MDKRLSKYTDFVIVLIFIFAIGLPFLDSIAIHDKKTSLVEKRVLETIPDLPDSKKTLRRYPDKFNTYYKDHFGFRDEFLHIYYRLKYAIGDSASQQVIFGKHKWLFFRGPGDLDLINVTRNIRTLTVNELEQYAAVLQAKHLWLKSRGVEYLFVIAPNKHSIYPENLPDHMYKIRDNSLTDDLVNYVRENTDVNLLDLRTPILSAKSDDQLLYFPTDTHWNFYGANIGQYEIAKAIASYSHGRIKPKLYGPSEFTTTIGNGGDLAALIDQKNEFNEVYPSPKLSPCPDAMHGKQASRARFFTTVCDPLGINIVVYRDSFFKWLQPYISQYANRATFIWKRMTLKDVKNIVAKEKPVIIIEEWAERALIRVPPLEPGFSQ